MQVAGVDVGSTAAKAVIIDEGRRILGRGLVPTGANVVRASERAYREALRAADAQEWEVAFTVGTGYGRYRVPFGSAQFTEIACHARGAAALFPDARSLIDIGGQGTRAIRFAPGGEVIDFAMNDACAAGTGRLLESVAMTLGMTLDEVGPASLRSKEAFRPASICPVFVETEIMTNLSRGRRAEGILCGIHEALAERSVSLLRRMAAEPPVAFTGGVSRNRGLAMALEHRLSHPVSVCEDSVFAGALGAALFALEKAEHHVGLRT